MRCSGEELLRLARWTAHRRYDTDDEDLIQSAVLAVLSKEPFYDPGRAPFVPWAVIVMHHAMQDEFRKLRGRGMSLRQPEASLDAMMLDDDTPFLETIGDPDDPFAEADARLVAEAARAQLERALEGMDGRLEYIVRGYVLLGLTGVELGQHLGISPSRVSQLFTKARRRLARDPRLVAALRS